MWWIILCHSRGSWKCRDSGGFEGLVLKNSELLISCNFQSCRAECAQWAHGRHQHLDVALSKVSSCQDGIYQRPKLSLRLTGRSDRQMKKYPTPKNVILQEHIYGSWLYLPAGLGPISHHARVTESGTNWAGPLKSRLLFNQCKNCPWMQRKHKCLYTSTQREGVTGNRGSTEARGTADTHTSSKSMTLCGAWHIKQVDNKLTDFCNFLSGGRVETEHWDWPSECQTLNLHR